MAIERRNLEFKTLTAVADDADRLRTTGYTRAGVWDLPRVCDHLSRYMRMSITSFPAASPLVIRLYAKNVELPLLLARHRMPAGKPALASLIPVQPATELDALAALRAICTEVQNFTGEFAAHPRYGRLSAENWMQLHLIHGSHHLSFLVPKKPERAAGAKPAVKPLR